MIELILANLGVRPLRTFISVIGVALGVTLVVLFTGLARGMTNDMVHRAANWKAEIVFARPGSDLQSSNTPVSTAYVPKLEQIEGIKSAVPVIRYITPNSKGRFGILQIDGVDWTPFAEMNDMRLLSGRAPTANDEVVVDQRQVREDNLHLGDPVELFGDKTYKVVGIFDPPSGSRIKMSLAAMQDVLQSPNKCTYILVKVKDGYDPEKVAGQINEALPGNKVNLTVDIVTDAMQRIPGLSTFLRVLVGLGAFVSTIFVLLSMYTTITERRKEIGILKSLGASTGFIIRAIEGEALMIGALGVMLGIAISYLASFSIGKEFELPFEFSSGWILVAIAIAVGGSLIGALYPAWRAAGIDPVEVMVNE